MNNQPTKEEINKKLSEFMGSEIAIPSNLDELSERQLRIYLPFSSSLDALVPVLQKLDLWFDNYMAASQKGFFFQIVHSNGVMFESEGETIQEAAALATYYAVMEGEK